MVYELRPDEPLAAAVCRAAAEDLTTAAAGLAEEGGPVAGDDAVHEARKSVKRVRSLLRLVRGGVDPRLRRDLNARLRAVAASLGEIRDAQVLVETASSLRAADDGVRAAAATAAAVTAITDRRAAVMLRTVAGPTEGGAVTAAAALVDVRGDLVEGLHIADDGPGAVADGLRRAYRGGRDGLAVPVDTGDGEAFHEWRKRAKDLRYHLEFLAPLWPGPLTAHAKELHRLTDLLGDEHDLGVLATTLEGDQGRPTRGQRTLVLRRIAIRRRDRREAAHALGRLVYAEGPDRFVRRISRYWDAARRG